MSRWARRVTRIVRGFIVNAGHRRRALGLQEIDGNPLSVRGIALVEITQGCAFVLVRNRLHREECRHAHRVAGTRRSNNFIGEDDRPASGKTPSSSVSASRVSRSSAPSAMS